MHQRCPSCKKSDCDCCFSVHIVIIFPMLSVFQPSLLCCLATVKYMVNWLMCLLT